MFGVGERSIDGACLPACPTQHSVVEEVGEVLDDVLGVGIEGAELADGAVAAQEEADGGGPVEAALEGAVEEGEGSFLFDDVPHDGEGVARVVVGLGDDAGRRDVEGRRHERAGEAAEGADGGLGAEGVDVDRDPGGIQDVDLEALEDGDLDRTHGDVADDGRGPRPDDAPPRLLRRGDVRHGLREAPGDAGLDQRLDRLRRRTEERPAELADAPGEEVHRERHRRARRRQ
mmetsp:Transcript_19723/g.63409  ORF Transcript_19723/g.63409 Transcript_19723/m.63409 type:complete len:231 (-) Transcript_19723:1474-2166(-)